MQHPRGLTVDRLPIRDELVEFAVIDVKARVGLWRFDAHDRTVARRSRVGARYRFGPRNDGDAVWTPVRLRARGDDPARRSASRRGAGQASQMGNVITTDIAGGLEPNCEGAPSSHSMMTWTPWP